VEIDVATPQAKGFTRAESRSVQDQQQKAERGPLNERRGMNGLCGDVEQSDHVVARVDIPLEGRVNSGTGFGQRRVGEMASSDCILKESAERAVFACPEARRRTLTAAERRAHLRGRTRPRRASPPWELGIPGVGTFQSLFAPNRAADCGASGRLY